MSPVPSTSTLPGSQGGQLVLDRWPAARPVTGDAILLHGGGQTRHAWGGTASALAGRGWNCIAYDARGHGESAWDRDGDYGHSAMVADLFCVTEGCATPPVLIGASMGGMASIVACGEHPERFRALVIVDVALTVDTPEAHRIQAFMRARPDGFADLEEAADAVQAYNPARPRPPSAEGLKRNLVQRADGRWYWRWDPRLLDLARSQETIAKRLRGAASRIAVPTLLVRGTRSQMVSDTALADFVALVPHAWIVDVAGAGHMVAGDDNDSFTQAVAGFLDELSA